MGSRRWLLLLGSNLPQDDCVAAALEQLAQLGTVSSLTPIRRFPSHDGGRGDYFNALAALTSELDAAVLAERLKRLEIALGRRRDIPGQVAIDLDILAGEDDGHWRAAEHAVGKREFDKPAVAALLREASIDL
jgi:2-amino-4-hydroxy-6-hydroxymethyldihydropteridine diphosphokinase